MDLKYFSLNLRCRFNMFTADIRKTINYDLTVGWSCTGTRRNRNRQETQIQEPKQRRI